MRLEYLFGTATSRLGLVTLKKLSLLSEKCPRMNFLNIGRAKRSFTLTDTASFCEAERNSRLRQGLGKDHTPDSRVSQAKRSEQRGKGRSPEPGSDFQGGPAPLRSNLWGLRIWIRARLALILGSPTLGAERRVQRATERAGSPVQFRLTLASPPFLPVLLLGLCSASTCWMWRW